MWNSRTLAIVILSMVSVWLFSDCARYISDAARLKIVDLTEAVIVVCASESRHAKAAEMLQDEIGRRTGVRLASNESMPKGGAAAIVLGTVESLGSSLKLPKGLEVPAKAEGYAIWVDISRRQAPTVYLVGRDDRGALFAAGRLIRLARMRRGNLSLPAGIRVATAPRYPLRGHMLIPGGKFFEWDAAGYEQYVRDMVIFGTNSFELNDFHGFVAEMLDSYGLDLWTFFGHGDVVDMKTLSDVKARFGHLKGLRHVFIPLGDTSGVEIPTVMIPATDRFAALLKEAHPEARIWLSHQCQRYHAEHDYEYLFGYIQSRQPDWLEGMVYGPWARGGISELRQWTPKQYKVRHYPDICHNRRSQYLIPKWDAAFASIWERNGIRAMPRVMARVHNVTAPLTDGFVAYNHTGCNNDLAKFVFSAMAWNPDTDVNDVLREYGRVFFGEGLAGDVAKGLLMLEDNWTGPIAENDGIEKTLEHWCGIARRYEDVSSNWRLELYLYKAFIDAYIKRKHALEMELEAEAYEALRRAEAEGVDNAIDTARAALARVDKEFASRQELRQELESWGLSKYEKLEEILSRLYERPLNDRLWLEEEFKKVLAMEDRSGQLAGLERIINWEDAGPGGFYDNLGVEGKMGHLVRQMEWKDDPGYVHSPIEFHQYERGFRQSWMVMELGRYDTPLLMRYDRLEPEARYRVRVVYSGPFGSVTRLLADGQYEIHGGLEQPEPMRPLEFDIPENATADGNLNLEWQLMNLRRAVTVAEVWLIKRQE